MVAGMMHPRRLHSVLAVVAALVLPVLAQAAAPRERLDLDGTWRFATDPEGRGETERWFEPTVALPAMPLPGYAPDADGTIRVPGIWDNQGYGTETPKVRHNFVGKGWYQRTVSIPAGWAGRRAFLAVTGVSRYAKAWINGQFVGEHIGYVSPAEFEVTDHIVPGQPLVVVIQVDSKQRWEVDALYGASALADYVDVAWGGIWGHVYLEARAGVWLDDLFVSSEVAGPSCVASAMARGQAGGCDGARLEVFEPGGRQVASVSGVLAPHTPAGAPLEVHADLPGAELWTPDRPTLYTARLSLLAGDRVIDAAETRFGLREFRADGYRLLLNGKPMMLRGYGDDHIYVDRMGMPSDNELHRSRLRLIKRYGFNHVRHHSTMMPPEYYDACDEVGIVSTAEFPIVYAPFLPGRGETWRAHVAPGTDPGPALETYRREWAGAIRRLRNHPSILCWVMGNELYEDMPLRHEFGDLARSLDPSRFFVDSDGASQALLDPTNDRPTADLYFVQFDEGSNPLDHPGKFSTPEPRKPTFSHEAGNYVTFSRPDLPERFGANMKPFWMTAGGAKLAALGLSGEAERWAAASERLYLTCHKANLEALRANPRLSGYHWWLFQDYWTSSNGLVDHTFRPKSITPEEVLRFNREVVLLVDGLARTYRSGERLELTVRVSSFADAALSGRFAWEVRAGEQAIGQAESDLPGTVPGSVGDVARIGLELPAGTAPAKLTVAARIVAGQQVYRNDWAAWLYPADTRPRTAGVPVFADDPQREPCADWALATVPPEGDLPARAVYVVGWLEPRLIAALERGASVLLLDGVSQVLPTRRVTFRTTWWKAGDSADRNHCGTYVYDHPVTRGMAPDGWCDEGWFYLVEGGAKSLLEKAPVRPEVLIRALPSLALVQDEALLYEVGVGKGTLIVSGLNHRLAKDRPENRWLVARLIEHATRLQPPAVSWPVGFLSPVESAPEGCLLGYRRILANEGEDDLWYSHREDMARIFICRQTRPGNRLLWQTAPVPQATGEDRMTFAFAGGLGYATEPATAGFVLEINGKDGVPFDLPGPTRWENADKAVELRFDVKRTVGPDTFGVFYVTVPRDRLTPGKPCQFSVRSVGTGSRRWFGLYSYTDL